jgi:hypothetical protein
MFALCWQSEVLSKRCTVNTFTDFSLALFQSCLVKKGTHNLTYLLMCVYFRSTFIELILTDIQLPNFILTLQITDATDLFYRLQLIHSVIFSPF